MTTFGASLLSAMFAVGLILLAVGIRGTIPKLETEKPATRTKLGISPTWIGLGIAAAFLGWALTGWPAMSLSFAGAVGVSYYAMEVRRWRNQADDLAVSLASWAEMLSDVMRSHSALGQAIQETASSTSETLRPHVSKLAARAQATSMQEALIQFAVDVDHGTADVIVTALQIADDGQGRNIPAVLEKIADQTRIRTEMLLRIESSRSKIYSEARTMVALTLAMVAASMVFGRPYLIPYNPISGQIVLLLVGALFTSAGIALVRMGRPVEMPRLLRSANAGLESNADRGNSPLLQSGIRK